MKFRDWFLVVVIILGLSLSGWSKESNPDKSKPKPEVKPEPKSNFSLEFWYQQFYFEEEEIFEEVFDQEHFDPIGIRFGGFPLKNLEIAFGVGYVQEKGYGVGSGGIPSGEEVRFTIVPVQLELCYRLDFLEEQLLVPSVGVGWDWWYFKEDNEFADDVEGDKTGWHGVIGLGILLDRIDPSSRFYLQNEWGIENVFLEITYRYGEFEKEDGFNFSGVGYSIGLRSEF